MGADPLNYDIDFDIMIYFALCMYMHRGTLVYIYIYAHLESNATELGFAGGKPVLGPIGFYC